MIALLACWPPTTFVRDWVNENVVELVWLTSVNRVWRERARGLSVAGRSG